MQNKTTEFSFILKCSNHGVGIFATHNIKAGTYLRLFGENIEVSIMREKKDIPKCFQDFCIDRNKKMISPKDFGNMEIGWYVNHSKTPNSYHQNYNYYALRDILAGEEILIDYNTLEEPEEAKEDYYKLNIK